MADGRSLDGRLADAIAHDLAGRYHIAGVAFDALIVDARKDPPAWSVLAEALARLAGIVRYAGDLARAGALLDEAVSCIAAATTSDRTVAALVELEHARWVMEADGPDRAQGQLERALELATALPPGPARDLAMCEAVTALGAADRLRGAYEAAERWLLQAVDQVERAMALDGRAMRSGMALVHALDELGVLYKFSGAFEASAAAYERARSLLHAYGGPDHPDHATIDHNLGGLAHARGDGAAAERFARRAVVIHERSLGPDHLATVLDRSALAAVLDQQGAHDAAMDLLIDCAGHLERALGPAHRELAVVLNNQAAIHQRAGRLVEAEDLHRRAASIKERALGPDSPSLAISLTNLATVQRRLGRLDEAARNARRALDIVLAAAGPGHPHVPVIERIQARIAADRAAGVSGH